MSDASDKAVSEMVESMDPGSMVTKYVLVAEALDSEGRRALYTNANDKAKSWEIMGLLQFAIAKEMATIGQARPEE